MSSTHALLRSERAYLRWYDSNVDSRPGNYYDSQRERRQAVATWRERAMRLAPTSYPVLASTTVESYGYEESAPVYVYPEAARRLLDAAAEGSHA